MSMRTTSGLSRGISANASSAVAQANTQRNPGAASIHWRKVSRITALSSTMAMLFIRGFGDRQRQLQGDSRARARRGFQRAAAVQVFQPVAEIRKAVSI